MAAFKGFTNLQPVTKTVKFRLEPVGNTMKNIEANNVLKNAEIRAEKRQALKEYIDQFHKDYIEKKLSNSNLLYEKVFTEEELTQLLIAYEDKDQEEVEKIYSQFGKNLYQYMIDSKEYKDMDKKEFINDILPKVFKDDAEALEIFEFFKKSTTEIKDLNKLRKNLYSKEENKHGTILKRTIWDNLNTYLSNVTKFESFMQLYQNNEILTKDYKENINTLFTTVTGNSFCGKEFDINAYPLYCSQNGIDKYNTLIGGYSLQDGTKVQGLNEIIQVHNSKVTDKNKKLPFFIELYKQMMTDSSSFSFLNDVIYSDKELYGMIDETIETTDGIISDIGDFLCDITSNELDKVYVSKFCFGDISNDIFKKYSVIGDAITEDYNQNHPAKDKESTKYINDRKKYLNNISVYSIDYINNLLHTDICRYFSDGIDDLINEYHICLANYKKFDRNKKPFRQNRYAKTVVKALLDSMLEIIRFMKKLVPTNMPIEKDELFYAELFGYISDMSTVGKLYNKARNYATKKEFEKKEIGITFNNALFLSGWTNSNVGCGAILLKDNNYYLAVIDPSNKTCLEPEQVETGKDNYHMIDYNLLSDPAKSLPHAFMSNKFLAANPEIVNKYSDLYDIYNKHKYEDYKYTKEDEQLLIKYYEECLCFKYDDIFRYKFKKPTDYNNIYEFFNDVSSQSYKIGFIDVSKDYIDTLINEGKIYLFKISSRDFSDNPKHTTTLFALYWKMLFDERNLESPVYKLNGGASISYREKSIKTPFKHKAGEAITLKKSKTNETKTFKYDIIKNRRYTYDSFFFSVSITANYASSDFVSFNQLANTYIKKNSSDMHIIGITRGIKNLLYYTVIDMQGNVVEHNSLNVIKNTRSDGTIFEDDYNSNLTQRAKENTNKKEQWDSEYTIKDLKQGYMSQVVSVISKLMIKYNAIIVLEDINGSMKDRMKAIEKTVFTDFENALLHKLNFLITDKNIINNDEGSVIKPYQLCSNVNSKNKMKFQNGFVFFLSPAYTTSLDPSTGFVNMLDLRYKGKESARITLNRFKTFDRREDDYRIAFDYADFKYVASKIRTRLIKTDWVINTKGIRYNKFRNKATNNKWHGETINLTDAFDSLFEEYGINISGNIIKQVIDIDKSALYDRLFELLRLTLTTNNNINNDYLYMSAVEGSKYNEEYGEADNIASYNMARKGLMAINKILESKDDLVKIATTNEEWLQYNQNSPGRA